MTLFSILLATLGIGLAIYFYLQSQKEREAVLYVESIRTQFVDISSEGASKLEVLFEGKPLGRKNVTAIQLYFWNAGKESIEHADVLQPIEIDLFSADEILEAKILKLE